MKTVPWFAPLALALSFFPATARAGTAPATPLAVGSDTASAAQLAIARSEGDAVRRCWELELPELAGRHAEQAAGEYRLIVTLTRPEGWYAPGGERLAWHEPAGARGHLRVLVLDGADGRTVPGLRVFAAVDGAPEQPLSFGWYPLLNGYGANVSAAPDASHAVVVRIEAASFRRHDPYNGERFDQPVVAEFDSLHASPAGGAELLSEVEERLSGHAGLQGGAMGRAVRTRNQRANGVSQRTGDYRLDASAGPAEAYWSPDAARLSYRSEITASSAVNRHVAIAARDAWTGRFLPELQVVVAVSTPDGRELGRRTQPLMWHPWLYHYGENWRLPWSGGFRVRASFPAPAWPRYGRTLGQRFAQGATIELADLRFTPGAP